MLKHCVNIYNETCSTNSDHEARAAALDVCSGQEVSSDYSSKRR